MFHISIMAAEINVERVIAASKRASEPEAIRASLFSSSPLRFTKRPSKILTTMATLTTIRVVLV